MFVCGVMGSLLGIFFGFFMSIFLLFNLIIVIIDKIDIEDEMKFLHDNQPLIWLKIKELKI